MGYVGVSREDVAAAIMRRHAGREGGNSSVCIIEPRTRRGALTALSTLGETYREGAATPAPLEQAVVCGGKCRAPHRAAHAAWSVMS